MQWRTTYLIILCVIIVIGLLIYVGESQNNTSTYSNSNHTVSNSSATYSGLKTYHLSNSQFQLPNSWEPIGNEGYDYASFTSSDLAICNLAVQELDKTGFDTDKSNMNEVKSSQTVSNVNIEKYVINSADGGPTSYVYFFEKNGKYYRVNLNIDNGSAQTRQDFMDKNKNTVDNLISTIVTTMS